MSTVIKVEKLSKRYRLGLKEKQSETLIGQISQVIMNPLDNLNKLRSLNKFSQDDDSVFWALKDVSFEVKEGEVLGIIGKNGAGKSTLLKILSQITEPTSGKIEIHGRVASLLEVGTGFHAELSGRENIYMNGTILGMSRKEIDQKLDEIIDFSGVEKFIDTPVKFYSSGMKVRLGFSVAAHLNPEVLIIDEVLAVGDHEFQKKCLGKMEDVSRNQGRTVLFVSHQMDSIRKLCSSSLLLNNGKVEIVGSTPSIIDKYLGIQELENFSFFKNEGFIRSILVDKNLLSQKKIKITVKFKSEKEIRNPVAGFVLYNQIGIPIFGSNPRFHSKDYIFKTQSEGIITAESGKIIIHSGFYMLSFWFGDHNSDFEFLENVIGFEYFSGSSYTQKPNPINIGSIDQVFDWKIE